MSKNKKKKKNVEPMIVNSLCPAPPGTTAVFDADGDHEVFPVLLFAVVDMRDDGHGVCGLVSADGGLFSADDDESFIGYWSKGEQTLEEFLADHAREED